MSYECSKCGDEVIYRQLSKQTKALSQEFPVENLHASEVFCRQCEIDEEVADDEIEESDHYDEVSLWLFSGLTITPEQRVVLDLNY